MKAAEMYYGQEVAIVANDPHYSVVKGRVIQIGGWPPGKILDEYGKAIQDRAGTKSAEFKAHRIEILNGSRPGYEMGIVGRRILGPWGPAYEETFQKEKDSAVHREIARSLRQKRVAELTDTVDRAIIHLKRLDIASHRGNFTKAVGTKVEHHPTLVITDVKKIEHLIQKYIIDNILDIQFKEID